MCVLTAATSPAPLCRKQTQRAGWREKMESTTGHHHHVDPLQVILESKDIILRQMHEIQNLKRELAHRDAQIRHLQMQTNSYMPAPYQPFRQLLMPDYYSDSSSFYDASLTPPSEDPSQTLHQDLQQPFFFQNIGSAAMPAMKLPSQDVGTFPFAKSPFNQANQEQFPQSHNTSISSDLGLLDVCELSSRTTPAYLPLPLPLDPSLKSNDDKSSISNPSSDVVGGMVGAPKRKISRSCATCSVPETASWRRGADQLWYCRRFVLPLSLSLSLSLSDTLDASIKVFEIPSRPWMNKKIPKEVVLNAVHGVVSDGMCFTILRRIGLLLSLSLHLTFICSL